MDDGDLVLHGGVHFAVSRQDPEAFEVGGDYRASKCLAAASCGDAVVLETWYGGRGESYLYMSRTRLVCHLDMGRVETLCECLFQGGFCYFYLGHSFRKFFVRASDSGRGERRI